MRIVLAYDIPDDTRRAKLHRWLMGLLEPVQKSVFEGDLSDRALARLYSGITHRIEPNEDDVRIWRLCGGCMRSTLLLGRARPVSDPDAPIVF